MQYLERLTCPRVRATFHPPLTQSVVIEDSTRCPDRCTRQPRCSMEMTTRDKLQARIAISLKTIWVYQIADECKLLTF